MQRSKIEWTDATWNPVRGCSRVSEGCRNCYAERVAARFSGPGEPYHGLAVMKPDGPHWTGKVKLPADHLTDPLRWRTPRRIFVNSMSDLFHEAVPQEWIARIFQVMAQANQHTYQILTKRPQRMLEIMRDLTDHSTMFMGKPLPNVLLGVSVEDQANADARIPLLLQTPAAVRFVSYEPALGPVDFSEFLERTKIGPNHILDWIIAGGESGPQARPAHPDWFRAVRDQCKAANARTNMRAADGVRIAAAPPPVENVPFFFKQWGE